jgi:hypothetical protein
MAAVEDELIEWWAETAAADAEAAAAKAEEYGSVDLVIMGAAMEQMLPESEVDGQELAIGFYLLGKIARALSAYQRGESPSDDTFHDITVYSMMARRLRANGGEWP